MRSELLSLLCVSMILMPLAACSVEKTQEGEMPDVEVEGGQLPKYDVDAADVDITTDTKTIEVPDIDIDVKPPGEGDANDTAEDNPPGN